MPGGLRPSCRLMAAEMGAWALLLPLLMTLAQAQVCSVNNSNFEIKENTNLSQPLVDIYIPEGQQVTLGPSSTTLAFRIQGTQLFLNVTPDYEEATLLQAHLECRRGDVVVTQLRVFVFVLDVNDNPPMFPFATKVKEVPEDTKVNAIVIPETELQAKDLDKGDILFYSLQEVTPGASSLFSLVGVNHPALRLDQPLDFYKWQNVTFQLLVRDTQEEGVEPSHTATATLVLEVQPADLRPPWFLPCAYADSEVCVQAQYHGAVPTGHRLPAPLTLRPGPIYAVDGDRGIGQHITYSIMEGQNDGTFSIDSDSGNLTMTRSVPSPKTFLLLVKGDQMDHARYSVTQVTMVARDANGSLPHFSQSLYQGTVVLGSGVGVLVKDAADPSQPLRVWAQDPEFPDLNSAIIYRVTNNTYFQMDGEAMKTATPLVQEGVFYAEVEANNTVTSGTASTTVKIQVSEQRETTPAGVPGTSTAGQGDPGGSPAGDKRFSVVEMGVLGGVLGALLLLALIALTVLVHKHYSHRLKCCSGKALEPQTRGFDNQAFLAHQEANWAPAPSPPPGPTQAPPADPAPPSPPGSVRPGPPLECPGAARDADGPAAVRSILTKERRPEGGYKAVWFGEDIGAEADVVVLNAPGSDAHGAGDSGSDSSHEDEDADGRRGGDALDDALGAGSTYV
ncbi:cadherin-related family member 5 isoform X3 [Manis pentadactyla]|uniref:cadherin-related family member 5 isoform X3 n=1 Tax=Manis pentadactyla TaxID=143292 RepID=UPI00255C5CEB|nr:cadherin-related family member 5 isoform X3 [Manis pentadactyla]